MSQEDLDSVPGAARDAFEHAADGEQLRTFSPHR
jgi:hypothetical protein